MNGKIEHRGVRLAGMTAVVVSLVVLSFLTGCASPKAIRGRATAESRTFDFARDTFSFANELVWQYGYDAGGHWSGHRREPSPDYTLHCFVLARSAGQFFRQARFDPTLPVADEDTYRQAIRRIVTRSLRKKPPDHPQKLVVPGYADLRQFSRAHEKLLKSECGGYLQSYFQRGNWRMIFPFSRGHQASTADQLLDRLAQDRIAVVHLVRFPKLSINHAVLIFDSQIAYKERIFFAYDPNDPAKPVFLHYDISTRTFHLPPTEYFSGGRVDVYQIYHRWNY